MPEAGLQRALDQQHIECGSVNHHQHRDRNLASGLGRGEGGLSRCIHDPHLKEVRLQTLACRALVSCGLCAKQKPKPRRAGAWVFRQRGVPVDELQRFLGEVPVGHFHALRRALAHALFSGGGGLGRGHDDLVARAPGFRRGHAVLVAGLQGLQQTHELVDRAAIAHRVVHHGAQDAVGVDEEGGAHGLSVGGAGVDHAVGAGDLHLQVFDDGEGNVHAEVLFDRTHPGQVGEDGVDRQAEQLAVHRLEGLGFTRETHELGGAHRGEVGRVREQDQPLALVVGQGAGAVGGDGVEVGRGLVEAGQAEIFSGLFHG